MYMITTSASQIKAKMGKYMRAVRDGHEIVITDRDRPVARLVPYGASKPAEGPLVAFPREPSAPPLGEIEVRSMPYRGTDTTASLRSDRERR